MPEGRRCATFLLPDPGTGDLRILAGVTVERCSHDELRVVSPVLPVSRDEAFVLELAGSAGVISLAVRVAESQPVVIDGSVRHRLRLLIDQARQYGESRGAQNVAQQARTEPR